MSIAEIALRTAINTLESVGATYTVTAKDGQMFTNEKPQPAKKKRNRRNQHGVLRSIYEPILSKIEPGQVCEVACPDGFRIEEIRAAACSYASRYWGPGKYTSSVSMNRIEFYRHDGLLATNGRVAS